MEESLVTAWLGLSVYAASQAHIPQDAKVGYLLSLLRGSNLGMIVGVPFPFLWGLWVALVDFLPMIGGALAGIPTVLFAFTQGLTPGIATAIVFIV